MTNVDLLVSHRLIWSAVCELFVDVRKNGALSTRRDNLEVRDGHLVSLLPTKRSDFKSSADV